MSQHDLFLLFKWHLEDSHTTCNAQFDKVLQVASLRFLFALVRSQNSFH